VVRHRVHDEAILYLHSSLNREGSDSVRAGD
jgi:hypothetical protein